jgi:N-succinyldiaminopimelate aminotransferase
MPWVAGLRSSLAARRDLMAKALADIGMDVFYPGGTYFITTDVRPLGESDAMTFCRGLPERCGVVAVPCSVFYETPGPAERAMVRWTFSKQEHVLTEALERLTSLSA